MSYGIAMLGTGLMAKIYADVFRAWPETHLVAVAGNTRESTEKFASEYGVSGYSNSQYGLLFERHPEIAAVVIATPEWVRLEPLKAAVKVGKPILLEKPFADSWETSLSCAQILREHQSLLEVCHVLRYSPRFCALKAAIDRGSLGKIRHIYARRHSNNIRVQRVLGKTDLAFWLAPHDVDMMRWVTGREVVEVFARSRGGLNSKDDYLIANLRFDDGVDAVLEISWCSPPTGGGAREAQFEVWGTDGVAEVDDAAMNVRIFEGEGKVGCPDTYECFTVQGVQGGYFRHLIEGFVSKLHDPTSKPSAVEDALENSRVCGMIRKSLEEGRVVKRSEFA